MTKNFTTHHIKRQMASHAEELSKRFEQEKAALSAENHLLTLKLEEMAGAIREWALATQALQDFIATNTYGATNTSEKIDRVWDAEKKLRSFVTD